MAQPAADYISINKANWDERAPEHAKSPNYALDRLLSEPSALSDVVSFDLPLLGEIKGLEVIHLQCHIGTDTLSLGRLGAQRVVGLDFSASSLDQGRSLAAKAAGGQHVSFVEASTYDALAVVERVSFDLVYTGIGALCWLPSIQRWAETVEALLKPGGRLFIREGHPIMFALDGKIKSAPTIGQPYFEVSDPHVNERRGTYVKTEQKVFKTTTSLNWNHGLGEIVQSLINVGLTITGLVEHKSMPWRSLPGQQEQIGPYSEWMLMTGQDNLPLTYTLQAVKK